jgi:hypothetical protein
MFDGETVEEIKARHKREWALAEKKEGKDSIGELFVPIIGAVLGAGMLYIIIHFLIKFW